LEYKELELYVEEDEKDEEDEEGKDSGEDEEDEKDELDDILDDLQPDGNYQRRSRDAIVRYAGVEIVRDNNTVKDLIEGVELELKRKTDGEESVKVDHDYEAITTYISDFIDYNNLLATYIYNAMRFDRDKTKQDLLDIYRGEGLTKQEYDESKLYGEAYERLLYNDREVQRIKRDLRRLMTGVYDTELGMDLSMLTQIGITNKEYDYTLENPLLEIDKEELTESLEANFDAIKQLFYKDTNEDNIVDDGLAYQVYSFLDRYRERRVIPREGVVYPGPLYAKIEILKDRLEDLEEDLEEAKEEIDEEVEELRQQFIEMNQAEDQQNSINDMFGSSGGNSSGESGGGMP
ncbi:MAG: flagellar filament capping protein FliD, partial [Spirochaetota bacterium]